MELFDHREMHVDTMLLNHRFYSNKNIEFQYTINEVRQYILIHIYSSLLQEFFHQVPKLKMISFGKTSKMFFTSSISLNG